MNNLKKRLILSCAAIGFSSFAMLANAQEQTGTRCKDQISKVECRQAKMVKFQAAREATWHDELKITTAQEPAWKAFIDGFHHQPEMNIGRHDKLSGTDTEKESAPERLEKKLAKMEHHQAAMKARLATLKTLYAELTPEQQTLFNKRLAEFDQRHRHHRHHGDRRQNKSLTNNETAGK